MSVTPPRETLLTQRANIYRKIADASALIAELPEDSPDAEAACNQLVESLKAANNIDKLLGLNSGD